MAFTNVKTQENLRSTSWRCLALGYYGPVYDDDTIVTPKNVGIRSIMRYNQTLNFKPGRFSVNPIEQVRHTRISTKPERPVLVNKKFMPNVEQSASLVSGELAATVAPLAGTGLDVPTSLPPATLPTTNQEILALSGAFEKIDREDFGVALWLAELRETIEMLRSPVSGFRKLWNEFIRSSRKNSAVGRKALVDSLTSQWLEYRYGITPLVLDICSILNLYEKGITRKERLMEKATRRLLDTENEKELIQYYKASKTVMYGGYNVGFQYTETRWKSQVVTARYYYRRNSGLAESLARLGFSPGALVGIAWELTPWSFVLDWIFNVGQWLNSIVPQIGIEMLGNTLSLKETKRSLVNVDWVTYQTVGSYPHVPYDSRYIETLESYCRLVDRPTPVRPALQSNVLNLKRSIDSISLIWQTLPLTKKR